MTNMAKSRPTKVVVKVDKPAVSGAFTTPQVQRQFSPLLAWFIVVVLGLAGLIFYIAFSKTVISVSFVADAAIGSEFTFEYTADELDAQTVTATVERTLQYTDFPNVVETPATATGTVTIINNYSAEQPLVETTRLLSKDGVLFRTAETVTVPAGGSVQVSVYADEAGASGNIGPSRFEIVALWEGLKDKIYGDSTAAMTGGVVKQVTVDETLLQLAEQAADEDLRQAAFTSIQQQVQTTASGLTAQAIALAVPTDQRIITPGLGEITTTITVENSGTAYALAFDIEKLVNVLERDTRQTISPDGLTYRFSVREDNTVVVSGSAVLPANDTSLDFIDRAVLTNRSIAEIESLLKAYPQVDSVSVDLAPFWATETPTLERQIKLKLAE